LLFGGSTAPSLHTVPLAPDPVLPVLPVPVLSVDPLVPDPLVPAAPMLPVEDPLLVVAPLLVGVSAPMPLRGFDVGACVSPELPCTPLRGTAKSLEVPEPPVPPPALPGEPVWAMAAPESITMPMRMRAFMRTPWRVNPASLGGFGRQSVGPG
jgi:hypothetical protein